ncbi:hypothetical protein [Variovorax paradoxus]|uniref:hypothetical protein n=1 Tax=Variovorax paradoxus TaxID=34073 RepID=UPI0018AD5C48|nr:hypothetical protein [Variovorax paradoxus]
MSTSPENAHGQTIRSALGVLVFARVPRFVVHHLNTACRVHMGVPVDISEGTPGVMVAADGTEVSLQ